MNRLHNASTASFWPGHFQAISRDTRGETTDGWATEERRERAGVGRMHGITEPELRRLLRTVVEHSMVSVAA